MSTNDIGWTVYVEDAHPATNDASGFAALTWTKANGIQAIPERGISHAGVDVEDLETGFTKQEKGAASGRDGTFVFREVASDTGQALLKTIANSPDGICSIKLVKGSGANGAPVSGDPVEYMQGILHSHARREKTTASHAGFSVVFRNNALVVDATQPGA